MNNEQLTIKSVYIYDILGRKQKAESGMQNAECEIKHLPKGIYIIKIITEKSIIIKKIINQ